VAFPGLDRDKIQPDILDVPRESYKDLSTLHRLLLLERTFLKTARSRMHSVELPFELSSISDYSTLKFRFTPNTSSYSTRVPWGPRHSPFEMYVKYKELGIAVDTNMTDLLENQIRQADTGVLPDRDIFLSFNTGKELWVTGVYETEPIDPFADPHYHRSIRGRLSYSAWMQWGP